MLNKKDYINYFDEILAVEFGMKKDAKLLLGKVKDAEAQIILQDLLSDETRHIKIVKEMIKLI